MVWERLGLGACDTTQLHPSAVALYQSTFREACHAPEVMGITCLESGAGNLKQALSTYFLNPLVDFGACRSLEICV